MREPWRVAVIGPEFFLDANRRVYSRLKMLQADFPKAAFHIITTTTGSVAGAAVRAAKKLRMEYSVVRDPLERAERVIAWWDFADPVTAGMIRTTVLAHTHIEVYDRENEPVGPKAAEEVILGYRP